MIGLILYGYIKDDLFTDKTVYGIMDDLMELMDQLGFGNVLWLNNRKFREGQSICLVTGACDRGSNTEVS